VDSLIPAMHGHVLSLSSVITCADVASLEGHEFATRFAPFLEFCSRRFVCHKRAAPLLVGIAFQILRMHAALLNPEFWCQ
jgi:hypothetical protein